jgi:hypothetical protein
VVDMAAQLSWRKPRVWCHAARGGISSSSLTLLEDDRPFLEKITLNCIPISRKLEARKLETLQF